MVLMLAYLVGCPKYSTRRRVRDPSCNEFALDKKALQPCLALIGFSSSPVYERTHELRAVSSCNQSQALASRRVRQS